MLLIKKKSFCSHNNYKSWVAGKSDYKVNAVTSQGLSSPVTSHYSAKFVVTVNGDYKKLI